MYEHIAPTVGAAKTLGAAAVEATRRLQGTGAGLAAHVQLAKDILHEQALETGARLVWAPWAVVAAVRADAEAKLSDDDFNEWQTERALAQPTPNRAVL